MMVVGSGGGCIGYLWCDGGWMNSDDGMKGNYRMSIDDGRWLICCVLISVYDKIGLVDLV